VAIVRKTFLLTGALEGQTVRSGRWIFVKGCCQWQGLPEDEIKVTSFLKRMWQVEVKDGWISDKTTEPEGKLRDSAADEVASTPAPEREETTRTEARSTRGLPSGKDRPRTKDNLDVKTPRAKEAPKKEVE